MIRSIQNDKVLRTIISPSIVQSFVHDAVQVLCSIVEKNFHENQIQYQQTIDFLTRWLLLIDEDEKTSFNASSNGDIWGLAQIYSLIEYEEKDLLSFYSVCRMTENLDIDRSFDDNLLTNEETTRAKVRENFYQLHICHL